MLLLIMQVFFYVLPKVSRKRVFFINGSATKRGRRGKECAAKEYRIFLKDLPKNMTLLVQKLWIKKCQNFTANKKKFLLPLSRGGGVDKKKA